MIKILSDFLLRKNLDIKTMSTEEKQTFDRWNSILSGEEVTVDAIAKFCEAQRDEIERMMGDLSNSKEKTERLTNFFVIYGRIHKMITAKRLERDALEKDLRNQLDMRQ